MLASRSQVTKDPEWKCPSCSSINKSDRNNVQCNNCYLLQSDNNLKRAKELYFLGIIKKASVHLLPLKTPFFIYPLSQPMIKYKIIYKENELFLIFKVELWDNRHIENYHIEWIKIDSCLTGSKSTLIIKNKTPYHDIFILNVKEYKKGYHTLSISAKCYSSKQISPKQSFNIFLSNQYKSNNNMKEEHKTNNKDEHKTNNKNISNLLCIEGDEIEFNSDPEDDQDIKSHIHFGTVLKMNQNSKTITIKLQENHNQIYVYFIDEMYIKTKPMVEGDTGHQQDDETKTNASSNDNNNCTKTNIINTENMKTNNNTSNNKQGNIYTDSLQKDFEFVWQWLGNDGSWNDYDTTTSALLEKLSVGNQISINIDKFTYDITKISHDSCKQTNRKTMKSRKSRRAMTSCRYSSRWQVLTDDYKWKYLSDANMTKRNLDRLPLNGIVKYSVNNFEYSTEKIAKDEAIQTNDSTNKRRHIRRILYDNKNKKRVVWQFKDDKNEWMVFDNVDVMFRISILLNGEIYNYSRAKFAYMITKIDEWSATQINMDTNKIRECKMVNKNMDEMDPDWILNEQSINKQNSAAHEQSNDNDKKMEEYIYKRFCETWKDDKKVDVISICKIKNNALTVRTKAYIEFLKGKKEELKAKNVKHIERILFHGTSFRNIDKIINNGFNRDFNHHHRYGKGSYFSNRTDVSKRYCSKNNKDEYVMLICRVIIGEFCKGAKGIDGSNWPTKSDKKTPYESCVNNVKSPTIFVINNDSHAVPTHILTFKYMK